MNIKGEDIELLIESFESEEMNVALNNQICDLSSINTGDLLCNSDLIVSILEIATNSRAYGLRSSNKTKFFWKEVTKRKELRPIFHNFKPEVLRKYWLLLCSAKPTNIASIVKSYSHVINNCRLFPTLSILSDYSLGKISNLDSRFNDLSQSHTTNQLKRRLHFSDKEGDKNLIDEDSIISILENSSHSKKMKRAVRICSVNNNNHNLNIPRRNQCIFSNDADRVNIKEIEEIIETLNSTFQEYSKEEILQCLRDNSFNVKLTYLMLKDPLNFSYLPFSDVDDYIIKHMKHTALYERMVQEKGDDIVQNRSVFLNIEDSIV